MKPFSNCQGRRCYLHPYSHASYYPNASPMVIKVLFSPSDGRLMGTQVVGIDGVDKRIDVFATAMMAHMTVNDLEHLELGYVPQYGSAKDAVNMAGYVASNILRGDAPTVYWNELSDLKGKDALILDVRTENEVSAGAVPGAKHIPLNELRDRLNELPRDAVVYSYCQAGLRSYIATRILLQAGFNTKNISGGFRTYKKIVPSRED